MGAATIRERQEQFGALWRWAFERAVRAAARRDPFASRRVATRRPRG